MTTEPEFTLDSPAGHITRDGRKARIICVDVKDDVYSIIALVCRDNGTEYHASYTADGREYQNRSSSSVEDLINAPAPKRMVWLVWREGYSFPVCHLTEELAREWAKREREVTAIMPLEVPAHGTGLEGGE